MFPFLLWLHMLGNLRTQLQIHPPYVLQSGIPVPKWAAYWDTRHHKASMNHMFLVRFRWKREFQDTHQNHNSNMPYRIKCCRQSVESSNHTSSHTCVIRPSKEEGGRIRQAAKDAGQSTQAYILQAIRERMERDEQNAKETSYLESIVHDMETGKAHFAEHELIED